MSTLTTTVGCESWLLLTFTGSHLHGRSDRLSRNWLPSSLATSSSPRHLRRTIRRLSPLLQARLAHRAEIARGDAKRYTREIHVHPDGSKTLTVTKEEPPIKDRLLALDKLDKVTGLATRK